MIKTIIVDDEAHSIDALKILLSELRNDIEVIGVAGNAAEAIELIRINQPNIDLVFLDIQMPVYDGFTILEKTDFIDFKIIFVTAYDHFALRAIKFSALDYLLKPVDPYELNEALNQFDKLKPSGEAPVMMFKKAIEKKNLFDKLAISMVNEVQFVPIENIIYMRSDSNYTTIYLENNQQLLSSKGIGFYEELLELSHFFRIHNSYLINLKKVRAYIKGRGGYIKMENGTQLEVSVRKKDDLMKILNLS